MRPKLINIPNLITLMRIALVPILVFFFYLPGQWTQLASAALFALAGITDWIDGFLARKLKQLSAFGSFIDPVADKLIIAVALILLVGAHGGALIAIPALVIVGREIVISALREWMAELGKRGDVAVSWLGKVKTFVQFLAIMGLLCVQPGHYHAVYWISLFALYIAAGLTLWSMTQYIKAAWESLHSQHTV